MCTYSKARVAVYIAAGVGVGANVGTAENKVATAVCMWPFATFVSTGVACRFICSRLHTHWFFHDRHQVGSDVYVPFPSYHNFLHSLEFPICLIIACENGTQEGEEVRAE